LIHNSEFFCNSTTGVRQGDVLGPLFFAIGLHPLILELKERFPEIIILAYLDDITLMGNKSDLVEAFQFLRDRSARLGLQVNEEKSFLFSGSAPLAGAGVTYTNQGIMVLGSPVGPEAYVASHFAVSVEEMTACLDKLGTYSPDIGYTILRSCIVCRPSFLFKSILPSEVNDHASFFDRKVTNALGRMLNFDIVSSPESLMISRLPIRCGGLGLRAVGDSKDVAWSVSFTRSYQRLSAIGILDQVDAAVLNRYQEFALNNVSLPNDKTMANVDSWDIPTIREIMDGIYKTVRKEYLGNATSGQTSMDRMSKAAWLNSNGSMENRRGANEWIFSVFNRFNCLTTPQYADLLRTRLVARPYDSVRRCECGFSIDPFYSFPESDQFHCLICPKSQGFANARHKDCIDALSGYIGKVVTHPHVAIEPHIGNGGNRGDIAFELNGQTHIVDVCITTPTAMSYLPDSFITPRRSNTSGEMIAPVDNAATFRVNSKTTKYRNILRDIDINSQPIVDIFPIDATGRLSSYAMKFLDLICDKSYANWRRDPLMKAARKAFYMQISVICARHVGYMINAWRRYPACPPPRVANPPVVEDAEPLRYSQTVPVVTLHTFVNQMVQATNVTAAAAQEVEGAPLPLLPRPLVPPPPPLTIPSTPVVRNNVMVMRDEPFSARAVI
jgi:hypothetical protein